MLNAARNLMVALAAGSLVMTPVAAQANTRAGDSPAFYTSAQVQPGLGRSADGEGIAASGDVIALLLVGLWITGIVVIIADLDDNDNQSPGAN
ncbi:hypothetical protein [Erythrobacter sp. JK5]|uniref:hypothetical protein n=1 Tax=Erythrobacter sp. JK5 TaxID=2829500 RepID=UPI001BAE2CCB|nr:hypothetical protein [Erythrobacter sp. JK5]QUL37572.1 hypothetical protein KDC96_14685 [Erythrobacter sp. JK5]